MPQTPLLPDVESFLAASRMAESAFGRAAVNDWKFVTQLRGGRRVWPETEAKVRAFMEAERAADLEVSEVVSCSRCDLRAEAPQVSACTRTDCPMARSCEALAA